MATFEDIKNSMSDSGAKNDAVIDRALSMLPLKIVLSMSAKDCASYVQKFFENEREIYLKATR